MKWNNLILKLFWTSLQIWSITVGKLQQNFDYFGFAETVVKVMAEVDLRDCRILLIKLQIQSVINIYIF